MQKRLYLIAAVILLAGLGSAAMIYRTAGSGPGDELGYEMADGRAYPVMPEDSKMYRHDLELYGGKFNVMADEFTRWFDGLWHGKTLAFTVACVTVITSLGFFFAARRKPPLKSGVRDETSGPDADSQG